MLFLYVFCFSLHLRVLYTAFNTFSINAFLFSTLPNFVSFWLVTLFGYQALNCFFTIYVLTCIFIQKNIQSSTDCSLIDKGNLNDLIKLNLKSFNNLIQIFELSQKNFNLTLTTFYK